MDLTPLRTGDRLDRELAAILVADMIAGKYSIGTRLPAERELAATYNMSRPTVREAIIALEVQGLVEVRLGSGAWVMRLPEKADMPDTGLSAFELTEARLLIEGEAASLAASQASEEDLAEITVLVEQIAQDNRNAQGAEQADRAFHLAVARATRNQAMLGAVTSLWDLRETSQEAALLHAKARTANIKPVVEEHRAVLDALWARDGDGARNAMRAHLAAVLEALLFATEGPEQAERQARYRQLAD